ncbi:MAG: hypothetical protein IJ165_06520 [Proteobacteria bacterium]|nr:hypothetical protein [Pseudomonadota bacterium]
MKLRFLWLGLLLVGLMTTAGGCRMVFEPETDALARLFASLPTGDNRVVREFCDGEKVCKNLNALAGIVRSQWYNSRGQYYQFDEIEIVEETGYSYVHARVRMPAADGNKETMFPMVFEMERIKLRWHIYSVQGLDEFLRRAQNARY